MIEKENGTIGSETKIRKYTCGWCAYELRKTGEDTWVCPNCKTPHRQMVLETDSEQVLEQDSDQSINIHIGRYTYKTDVFDWQHWMYGSWETRREAFGAALKKHPDYHEIQTAKWERAKIITPHLSLTISFLENYEAQLSEQHDIDISFGIHTEEQISDLSDMIKITLGQWVNKQELKIQSLVPVDIKGHTRKLSTGYIPEGASFIDGNGHRFRFVQGEWILFEVYKDGAWIAPVSVFENKMKCPKCNGDIEEYHVTGLKVDRHDAAASTWAKCVECKHTWLLSAPYVNEN